MVEVVEDGQRLTPRDAGCGDVAAAMVGIAEVGEGLGLLAAVGQLSE
jgi:hypothetical protein